MIQDIHHTRTLSCEAELALLCRILAREGYCDHIAGHITYALPDETFLVNPFELIWEEVQASDIVRIDAEGNKLEGKWSVTPAIPIHVETHKVRPDIKVAVHNHSRWGTIWANVGRVPPVYEQTSAYIAADIAFFEEYEGGVNELDNARAAARALGGSGCALLKNHGVLVVGQSIRQAHMRAVALETRCRIAWHVEVLGGGDPMKPDIAAKLNRIIDTPMIDRAPHMWDSAVRRELRADPEVLS